MDPRHARPARAPDPRTLASHALRRRARAGRRTPYGLRPAPLPARGTSEDERAGAPPPPPPGPPFRRPRARPHPAFAAGEEWDRHPRARLFDAAQPEGERRSGVERRSGEDRRTGPYPGGRRATDRHPPEPLPEGWRRRAREILRKVRDPLIGLTLAGAAAPLAAAVATAPTGKQPQPRQQRRAPAPQAARPRPPRGIEVRAPSPAEEVRNAAVERAMQRYDISRDLAEDIYDAAVEADIDPALAYGLVKTESNFDHRAVSNVGARGLTQLMPRTARWLMPGISNEDLFDRQINLRLGFHYLRDLIDQYDGNIRLALLAYNRGPGTVDRVLARGGDPNNGYADMVLSG
ncbi:MAG TPA: lytic transglycosylase domain-containing protein [Longimicrobiales bacterium]